MLRYDRKQMKRTIVSVAYLIPGQLAESVEFKSNDSILGADILVFSPDISSYSTHEDYIGDKTYAGLPLKNQRDSALLREHSDHWRSELDISLRHGKTVFVIFSDAEQCYVHTGNQTVSGTGRSQRVTNIVNPYDPYSVIPVLGSEKVHRSRGDRIKPTQDVGPLSAYWQEFGPYSYYEAYLDRLTSGCLVTETGSKIVGGVAQCKDWKGSLVVLPPVDFPLMIGERAKQLSKRSGSRSANTTSKAESSVGKQFIDALVQVDKAVRMRSDRTPAPQWVARQEYALEEETTLEREIAAIHDKIIDLQKSQIASNTKLEAAGNLKGLLYETGTPLESALLEALRLLGFHAENYKDAESEFDALFVDPDGEKLLGEAEGKTDKAINIDKLDQLNRNVQEEFAKRPDAKYSKGVLFGNAFRLVPLQERGDFFTEKCLAGAARLGFALVRTPDLFSIAKYLKENTDSEFARLCREAILKTSGKVVTFPSIPKAKTAVHQ